MKNIILLILLFPSILISQDIDMDRMNRDLKVAENGLKSLIQDDNRAYFPNGQSIIFSNNNNSIEGKYIKEYGAIFTVQFCEPCIQKSQNNKITEEGVMDVANHLIDAAKTFLSDYGSIIGQLTPDQKIMIRFTEKGGNKLARVYEGFPSAKKNLKMTKGQIKKEGVLTGRVEAAYGQNNPELKQEITVMVNVSDLISNMTGNLSREKLLNKITTETINETIVEDAQLEAFTAMFHRLYEIDLSSTYYMSSRPSYSKITNVGVIIEARVYSSNLHQDRSYSIPTRGETDLSLEERNTIVRDMLPEFEKEFKENVVSYARTIRSLEKGQAILFEIRMTACKECYDFPKYMNFSIAQETLDQFNKGKITFEQAADKVSVEKKGS